MNKIKEFINQHMDFKVYPVTIPAIIVALAVVPCIKFLPEQYGFENGLLENIQMITLFIAFVLSVTSKTRKKFFYFVALVIVLISLREVNYGRTLFFPIPGEVNAFYSWKEIKYGWLVNPLVGLYMAGSVMYFLCNKVFIDLWQIIKNIKFPVWNVLLTLAGIILGMYAEKASENFVFEEITELLFYVSLTGIIWLYSANKNFVSERKD